LLLALAGSWHAAVYAAAALFGMFDFSYNLRPSTFIVIIIKVFTTPAIPDNNMWRSGGNTHLLRRRSQVRFPHSANFCVDEQVCLY
jgi:hypothetical protein